MIAIIMTISTATTGMHDSFRPYPGLSIRFVPSVYMRVLYKAPNCIRQQMKMNK